MRIDQLGGLVDFLLDDPPVGVLCLAIQMSTPILTGTDYLSLPRLSETFLVEPLLPTGGAMTIYGDPKVGKSFAALQLALAISEQTEWLGFPVKRKGRVVYVQLDTPRSLWAKRLDELRGKGEHVELIYFADRETLGTWPFNVFDIDHFHRLRDGLAVVSPDVVIIDTLKESHQLDENDATEAQKVIAQLTALTEPAALVLIHHGRKPNYDNPRGDLLADARGSGYLMGKMDSIVKMSRRSAHFVGRDIEEGSIRTERLDTGFWKSQTDETDKLIEDLMSTPGSVRSHAKSLAEKLGKDEEACRSLIRRWKASQKTK